MFEPSYTTVYYI